MGVVEKTVNHDKYCKLERAILKDSQYLPYFITFRQFAILGVKKSWGNRNGKP